MAETRLLVNRLALLNAFWFGASAASICGLALGLATLILVFEGGPHSQHLSLLGQYLPGYRVAIWGAFLGAFWGAVLGFLFFFPAAWLYYRLLLLRIDASDRPGQGGPEETVARLDLPAVSLATGLLCGSAIFLLTILLLVRHRSGEPLGPHLGLLGQVLPGYSVSFAGGLAGFAYFGLLGMAAAFSAAWLYNGLVSRGRKEP